MFLIRALYFNYLYFKVINYLLDPKFRVYYPYNPILYSYIIENKHYIILYY
jgi:hypothetical protein